MKDFKKIAQSILKARIAGHSVAKIGVEILKQNPGLLFPQKPLRSAIEKVLSGGLLAKSAKMGEAMRNAQTPEEKKTALWEGGKDMGKMIGMGTMGGDLASDYAKVAQEAVRMGMPNLAEDLWKRNGNRPPAFPKVRFQDVKFSPMHIKVK